jgi:hypothetical protein
MKPKATAARSKDRRLPAARSSSVFDRLYKTQTAASKAWKPARRQVVTMNSRSSKASLQQCEKIFTRLHVTGTISNASKRVMAKHPKPPSTPSKKTRSPLRTPTKTPSKKGDGYVYSPVSITKSTKFCFHHTAKKNHFSLSLFLYSSSG